MEVIPVKLTEIALGFVDIPLRTPFKTALRTVDRIHDIVVRVTGENGQVGYGEAPPTAVITGETLPSIEAAIRDYLAPALLGTDLEDPAETQRRMDKAIAKNTSAKAALDVAIYDLRARVLGLPLFRLLGQNAPDQVKTVLDTDLTISVNDPDTMAADAAAAVARGFRILKVKVGKGGAEDVARLRAIRKQIGPDITLRVDANQGWTPQEAVRTISLMEDAGLGMELVEQPVSCHDFRGLQYVTAHTATPILADESVFSPEDAERIIAEHAADLINIKLMKTGGIYEALRICSLAERSGVKCMMGCMLESAVSVSGAAHLAAARSVINLCDLDGPSLCAENPYTGGPVYEESRIFLPETPGIGISGLPVRFSPIEP